MRGTASELDGTCLQGTGASRVSTHRARSHPLTGRGRVVDHAPSCAAASRLDGMMIALDGPRSNVGTKIGVFGVQRGTGEAAATKTRCA